MVLSLALAAPAGASAEAAADATPGQAAAEQALEAAEQALSTDPGEEMTPDASVALLELATSYSELEGSKRRRARALLARPDDGLADQFGDGYPSDAPVASAESPHFCVFWVNDASFADAPDLTDTNPANGVPDYVDALLEIAEFSYSVEVTPGPLGWNPPKPDDSGCGADPSAHADLYLKQLGTQGLFGYQATDPGQGRARSQFGYMVLDNDYATAEYGFPDPLDAARVTFAHEFNHLLQVAYDTFQDGWMFESTATWVEDKVYPTINDYIGYVSAFASAPGSPITKVAAANGLKIYGTAVWNHWLDGGGGGFGVSVIPLAWDLSDVATPKDFAIAAYDAAIEQVGGGSFSRQFGAFATATAEWRTGNGGFPDAALLPDVRRKGSLGLGAERSFELDHTAYRLLNVKPVDGRIELHVRAEPKVRSAIALLGRDGDALTGIAETASRFLGKGGRGAVALEDAARFERITAVVVNADGRVSGFGQGDWKYSRDDSAFSLRISR